MAHFYLFFFFSNTPSVGLYMMKPCWWTYWFIKDNP